MSGSAGSGIQPAGGRRGVIDPPPFSVIPALQSLHAINRTFALSRLRDAPDTPRRRAATLSPARGRHSLTGFLLGVREEAGPALVVASIRRSKLLAQVH